jgi:DNA-directed RNA polymerase subunit RPC12/RpoP
MFYVKEKINDVLEIKVEIHDDNVFCTCPDCGTEIGVDISELFSDGESDLYGTAIFCPDCSQSRLNEESQE